MKQRVENRVRRRPHREVNRDRTACEPSQEQGKCVLRGSDLPWQVRTEWAQGRERSPDPRKGCRSYGKEFLSKCFVLTFN